MSHDYHELSAGDPAPWFRADTTTKPDFALESLGGRYIVFCFFGSADTPFGAKALEAVLRRRDLFDDVKTLFFGVSHDPTDKSSGRVQASMPGIRHIWDFDGRVGMAFGVLPTDYRPGASAALQPRWVVVDPNLRVMSVVPFKADGSDAAALLDYVAGLPEPDRFAGEVYQAPVLVLPNVFEPALCNELIYLYETNGGVDSGFMREVDGVTVSVSDARAKRRGDHVIEDQGTIGLVREVFRRRVKPEIQRAFQFEATRMERYIVGCYAAEDGGHFGTHRDNRTKGTAHRRFAVSVNLNDDFDGGQVWFPEYGPRSFKAPAGGAVVFSCSLLHAVTRVTRGRRYAFLPFLYDEAAARIRDANLGFVSEEAGGTRKG